jgi:hypothetical protein
MKDDIQKRKSLLRNRQLIPNFSPRICNPVQCKGTVRAVWALLRNWQLDAQLSITSTAQDGSVTLKDSYQGGGQADFSENLRASLFNKYQSNEPNFGRIHLAGKYL